MSAPTKDSVFRSMKRLFRNYNRGCARRNVFWDLTLEQFHAITSRPCFYCGKPPAQKARSYIYNGIDRKDNKRGYEPQNCVPCCKDCNWMKGDRLTVEEMLVVGKALGDFRAKKKG